MRRDEKLQELSSLIQRAFDLSMGLPRMAEPESIDFYARQFYLDNAMQLLSWKNLLLGLWSPR